MRVLVLIVAALLSLTLTACGTASRPATSTGEADQPGVEASEGEPALVGQDLIGTTRDGGIVVYVLQPEDDGYDQKVPHGVLAAPEDVMTTYTDKWNGRQITGSYVWSTGVFSTSGTDAAWVQIGDTSSAIGQGSHNTDAILGVYPAETYPNSASAVARAYRGGGKSDWFLPSIDELTAMQANRKYLGTLQEDSYWSSTEADIMVDRYSDAKGLYFNDPDGTVHIAGTKNGNSHVRAARYF